MKMLNYRNGETIVEVIDRGKTAMGYDLVVMYRILRYVREYPGAKISDIQAATKTSYATLSKYIDFLEEKGLIESKGRKPRLIYITKKGIDYLFLISQIERLIGVKVG